MTYFIKNVILLSLLLAAIDLCSSQEIANYEEIKDIVNHPEKLLIDVREPIELEQTGKYPNAINIMMLKLDWAINLSPEDFQKAFSREKPSLSDPIIIACKKGIRAKIAAEKFVDAGYTNVKYYKGSWNEWCVLEKVTCYENP